MGASPLSKMRGRGRLAGRMIVSHVLVILVVVGISGFGLLSQIRRYFVAAEQRALVLQAQSAADGCDLSCISTGKVSVSVNAGDLPPAINVTQNQLNNQIDNLVNQRNVAKAGASNDSNQISIALDSSVRVMSRSDLASQKAGAGRRELVLIERAFSGRQSSAVVGKDVVAYIPIYVGRDVAGVIEARNDLEDVDIVIGDLRRQIFIALAAGAIAAGLLGLWRARRLAQPIRNLTSAANDVADGRFDHPITDPGGRDEVADLTRAFVVMRNRVQHELATRASFVADASHELRTPLTSISGAIQILQTGGAEEPETRKRFLDSIERETQRLVALTDGLLALEVSQQPSAQVGSSLAKPETCDVVEVCRSIVEGHVVSGRDHVRLVVVAGPSCNVLAEAGRIRQVVANLVNNALAVTPTGSWVTIMTFQGKDLGRVEVIDEGPGVSIADRERAFERFVRLDVSRQRDDSGGTREGAGAGLGLAIARSIAEGYGGSVTLHSGPNGIGTTARFEFPA
jgi:signal transduction histidine kinase